jgi:hypothetical protein
MSTMTATIPARRTLSRPVVDPTTRRHGHLVWLTDDEIEILGDAIGAGIAAWGTITDLSAGECGPELAVEATVRVRALTGIAARLGTPRPAIGRGVRR